MTRVYLDHNATSPLRAEARDAMLGHLVAAPGNPGSVHHYGHSARMAVEQARTGVASLIGAEPEDIVLTGGGTESNNLALYGASGAAPAGARRIVTSAIEHPSILAVLDDLEKRGFEIIRVRPTREGVVEPDAILDATGTGTALVTLMLANNEIGTLQPVGRVGAELRRRDIPFHCDAAQAVGKIPIDVGELGVDALTLAGHKFGGPQGTGALYLRRGLVLTPHLRGGGQEMNRRPGTENVPGLVGLGAAAVAVREELPRESRMMRSMRERLETELVSRCPDVRVNGAGAPRIPNTSSLSFPGVTGEALVIALDLEGFAVSTGSACSAGTIRRSETLEAMGLPEESRCSIRVSLGQGTTTDVVDAFIEAVGLVLARLRSRAPVAAEAR